MEESTCKTEFSVSISENGLSNGTMLVITAPPEHVKGLAEIVAKLVGVRTYDSFDETSTKAVVDIPFLGYPAALKMIAEEFNNGFPTIRQEPKHLQVKRGSVEATMMFNTDFQSRAAPLMPDWN